MTWYLKREFDGYTTSSTGVEPVWRNPNATFEELRAVCNDRYGLPNTLTFNWEPSLWKRYVEGVYTSGGWTISKDEAHKATWHLANPGGKIVGTYKTLKGAIEGSKEWLPKPLEGPKGGGG